MTFQIKNKENKRVQGEEDTRCNAFGKVIQKTPRPTLYKGGEADGFHVFMMVSYHTSVERVWSGNESYHNK